MSRSEHKLKCPNCGCTIGIINRIVNNKEYFTSSEIATILGIPPRTARTLIARGDIRKSETSPFLTRSKINIVKRKDLIEFIESCGEDPKKYLGDDVQSETGGKNDCEQKEDSVGKL